MHTDKEREAGECIANIYVDNEENTLHTNACRAVVMTNLPERKI